MYCNRGNHGLTNTNLYGVWRTMKSRCFNPNNKKYKNYGGRGITVCDEWVHDFQAFYDWAMSHGYEKGLSIDRIDNDRDYSPENCRWTDWKTQANNRRVTPVIVVDGVRHTAKEWADIAKVNYRTILRRYHNGLTGKELIKEGRSHE
jgi:hypothetical protein